MIRVCNWCKEAHSISRKCQAECEEELEQDGSVFKGLVFVLPLGVLLWGVIAACLRWQMLAAVFGSTFAAFCVWRAWKLRGE